MVLLVHMNPKVRIARFGRLARSTARTMSTAPTDHRSRTEGGEVLERVLPSVRSSCTIGNHRLGDALAEMGALLVQFFLQRRHSNTGVEPAESFPKAEKSFLPVDGT